MKFSRHWVIGLGALLLAGSVQAGLIERSGAVATSGHDSRFGNVPWPGNDLERFWGLDQVQSGDSVGAWRGGDWRHLELFRSFSREGPDFLRPGLDFATCCNGFTQSHWRAFQHRLRLFNNGHLARWREPAATNVPEPGVFGLVLLGLVATFFSRRMGVRGAATN